MAPVIIRMFFFGFGAHQLTHMFSLFRRVLGLGFFPNVSQYIKEVLNTSCHRPRFGRYPGFSAMLPPEAEMWTDQELDVGRLDD